MIEDKYIVTGIDLGPDSETVVSYSAYIASCIRAAVRLLYVIDYLLTPPAYLSAYIEEEKKKDEGELSRWTDLLNSSGVKAEYRILLGRLHESFTSVIEEAAPELLVLGYKSHMFRPSSSERLIMSLRLPMLVIRRKSTDVVPIGSVKIKKILCPVDFSENSKKAVSVARSYALMFSAELALVNIIPSHLIREIWTGWKKLDEGDRARVDDLMYSEAESAMVSFCTACGIEGAGEVLHGNPGEAIPSLADERSSDLIVMGARGLSYLQSILIGSTTEQVLRSSPCPVLVVH